LDVDRAERAAVEAEIGSAVITHIDLQGVGIAGIEPQGELVTGTVADDLQRPALHVRLIRGQSGIRREAEQRCQAWRWQGRLPGEPSFGRVQRGSTSWPSFPRSAERRRRVIRRLMPDRSIATEDVGQASILPGSDEICSATTVPTGCL
jgi:hypothetical protein